LILSNAWTDSAKPSTRALRESMRSRDDHDGR
jgi:hypothetical protein